MRAILKKPGKDPEVITLDCNDDDKLFPELKKYINGFIETVTLEEVVMLLDDEGKLKNLQPNIYYHNLDYIAGNLVLLYQDGENLVSVPEKEIDNLLGLLKALAI